MGEVVEVADVIALELEPCALLAEPRDAGIFDAETLRLIRREQKRLGIDRERDPVAAAGESQMAQRRQVVASLINDAARVLQLDFGMVGVNEWAPQTVEAPFAGRKDSGTGHECGREGLLDEIAV